jgi:hypothetical protein
VTRPIAWQADGEGVQSNGDCGGDYQATDSFSVRYIYRRDDGKWAVATISFYGVTLDPDGDLKPPYRIERQEERILCTDPRRPVDTEEWADHRFLPAFPTCTTLEGATGAAREAARSFDPQWITWDGLTPWERSALDG